MRYLTVLYERWDSTGDHLHAVYYKYYFAQTFTVGNTGNDVSHLITSLKLRMRRVDTPREFIASIRATDGAGLPTGPDLTSAIYTDTLPLYIEWIEITLPQYKLTRNTKYAIVIGAPDAPGGGGGIVEWSRSTAYGYGGGAWCYSVDHGVTWGTVLTRDFTFYEYGLYNRVKTGERQNETRLTGKQNNKVKLKCERE